MLNFVGKVFFTPNVVFQNKNKNSSFSSSFLSKVSAFSIPELKNPRTCTIDYLVNKCGLSTHKSTSISKQVRLISPENADSVVSFLEEYGFSKVQITKIVSRRPSVLFLEVDGVLKPKFEYFNSLGFTDADIVKLFTSNPQLIIASLRDRIIPSVHFLKNLIPLEKDVRIAISRDTSLLMKNLESVIGPNIATLQRNSVPKSNILKLLVKLPRVLSRRAERFVCDVEEIKDMGFDPSRTTFVVAIHVFCGTNKHTWEKRLTIYREYGFTEEEILKMFRSQPRCMLISDVKMRNALDLFMKEMKLDSTSISKYPVVLMYSTANRVVPRYVALKLLISEGFLARGAIAVSAFLLSEKKFLEEFVFKYKEIIPQVLKTYEDSIKAARSQTWQEPSNNLAE